MPIDTCICPDCRTELDVDGHYGRDMKCGKCGCKITVFRDTDILVDTPVGVIGITLPAEWKEKKSWLKTLCAEAMINALRKNPGRS